MHINEALRLCCKPFIIVILKCYILCFFCLFLFICLFFLHLLFVFCCYFYLSFDVVVAVVCLSFLSFSPFFWRGYS